MRRRGPALGIAIIAVAAVAGAALYFSPLRPRLDARALVAAARENAWWTIPAYFVLYAVLDVLFIPTQFLSIAAVLIWGWWRGGIIELFAATIGAIPPYLIARSTLRDWILDRLHAYARASEVIEREGFTLLLLLRVVPVVPYTPLNYVAGLTTLTLSRYVLATFVGIMPSTFIFAWFVQSIAAGVMRPREATLRALAAGALFAALILATRLAAPQLRRRVSSRANTTSPQDGARRDSGSGELPPE